MSASPATFYTIQRVVEGDWGLLAEVKTGGGLLTEATITSGIWLQLSPATAIPDTPLQVAKAYDPATDPLAAFIGAFEFDVPDLAERHENYLAQAYAESHDERR